MADHPSEGAVGDGAVKSRQRLMVACAHASDAELEAALAPFPAAKNARDIRPPETGLIMLRGRIGGTGAPFNTGEATVTRAVVHLNEGVMGFGYQLGRSHVRARNAAVIDALGQDPQCRQQLESAFVEPVLARCAKEDAGVRSESAATRVNFFTMVRGEDE